VVYTGVTPVVSTIHAITAINGAPAAAGGSVTGKRFVLALNSGQVTLPATKKAHILPKLTRLHARIRPAPQWCTKEQLRRVGRV